MGLFNRNNGNSINEKLYETHGYVYNQDGIIYHIPQGLVEYCFPERTTGLSQTAIMELRDAKVEHIVVPGTFKKFNAQLLNFKYLKEIELQEGVTETKCTFDNSNVVSIKLPSTIEKVGAKNYPVVKDLVLPKGVIEIDKLFASHDTNLISVDIPGTLKVIPQGAFNQCKNLQTVILNEGVETSVSDAFRGTNNLHKLFLPSTYNGTINLTMDPRPLTSLRGNSKYDGKSFTEEQQETLSIKIVRPDDVLIYKRFAFDIKRGEQPIIEVKGNIIKIKCANYPQVITVDCSQLEEGVYSIQNGKIEIQKSQTFQEQKDIKENVSTPDIQSDSPEELDIIFQKAYRDNITTRDDFKLLPSETKMQVKKQMKVLFLELNNQLGTPTTSYEMLDYLYSRALNEINLGKYHTPETQKEKNTERKRLNRPHIKEGVRKKVIVRNIEQDKETLKRQREFILEGQRLAFEGQTFQTTEELEGEEELEENNGMSM